MCQRAVDGVVEPKVTDWREDDSEHVHDHSGHSDHSDCHNHDHKSAEHNHDHNDDCR